MIERMLLAVFMVLILGVGCARADLTNFMTDVNTSYDGDIRGFLDLLRDRYPVSGDELRMVVLAVDTPADAVVSLWLEEQAALPLDAVLRNYRLYHERGWASVLGGLGIDRDSPLADTLLGGRLGWRNKVVAAQ